MSRALAVLVAVGLSIVTPSPASAQVAIIQRPGGQPMLPPARDAAAPKTGTAKITGRVTAADSGQPLRKAQVRASRRRSARTTARAPTATANSNSRICPPAGTRSPYPRAAS